MPRPSSTLQTSSSVRTIRVGHTPDMDDAFMFYAIAKGKVQQEEIRVEHVVTDIQTLNQRALTGELDVTAISAASYPMLDKDYWIMAVGSSVGRRYGPLLVAKRPCTPEDLKQQRIGVPGLHTTAFLLLQLAIPGVTPVPMRFEDIPDAVLRGEVAAGLLIHERQLTYHDQGLLPILDLGVWWHQRTKLPIPLGLNVIKRSLGKPLARRLTTLLRESILYAMAHQAAAIRYSLQYGRGIDTQRARQFVGMYVNQDSLSFGLTLRKALRLLYHEAFDARLISHEPDLAIIPPFPKS